jgi:hypothetical protein
LHLSLSLQAPAVILSAAKDPDALHSPGHLGLPATLSSLLPLSRTNAKINFKKLENFCCRICCRFQPRFHHKLTTNSPSKNHVLHTEIRKTPNKNAIPNPKKKNKKKKTPKPFCGPGAIGLQAARKPNSVLDDHSSTRRITAAL